MTEREYVRPPTRSLRGVRAGWASRIRCKPAGAADRTWLRSCRPNRRPDSERDPARP